MGRTTSNNSKIAAMLSIREIERKFKTVHNASVEQKKELMIDLLAKEMENYARQKCEEQKIICAQKVVTAAESRRVMMTNNVCES